MAGQYSGAPAFIYGVGHLLRHQRLAQTSSPKTYLFQIDSILPDDQSLLNFLNLFVLVGGSNWLLKFFARIAAASTFTRPGSMLVSGSPIPMAAQSTNELDFRLLAKVYRI